MKPIEKPMRTRVFRAGNSQAVRIPKALELPEGEAMIERRAGGVFISTRRGRWDVFFDEPGAEFPFAARELRQDRLPRPVDLADKRKKPGGRR